METEEAVLKKLRDIATGTCITNVARQRYLEIIGE